MSDIFHISVVFEGCLANVDVADSSLVDAVVNLTVVNKLKALVNEMCCEVTIVTSMHHDKEADLRNWLDSNDVPYDKMFFDCPVGDVWISDNTVSVSTFVGLRLVDGIATGS